MSKLILLADDSVDDVLFFKRMLRRAGIVNPVHVVSDGYQAIAYLNGDGFFADRERFPEAGVVFLDLMMPRADGWFVLNWLSTQTYRTKLLVIVLTGMGELSRLHDAYALGAHSFIFKPIQEAELKGLLEYWPERWMIKESHKSKPGNRLEQRATGIPPYLQSGQDNPPGFEGISGGSFQ